MSEGEVSWLINLREELSRLPDKYADCAETLRKARDAFHVEIARAFESHMNAEVCSRPQDSYKEKRELCSWVNKETRELGLTVTCPKTGAPATLDAGYSTRIDKCSRFRFLTKNGDDPHRRVVTCPKLNDLQLQPDPPRVEGARKVFERKRAADTGLANRQF